MLTILIIVLLVFLVVGGLPSWGVHSYGYGPSGLLTVILVIIVIVLLFGGVGPMRLR